MSVPCCISNYPNPGFRCEQALDAATCIQVGFGGTPGLEGTTCADAGGCWQCPDIGAFIPCCFPGQIFRPSVLHENCIACGGYPAPRGECDTIFPEPECHAPRADRAAQSGLKWTIDLADEVAFGISDETSDSGEATPRTNRLSRAIGPSAQEAEPCAQFDSRYVMLDNGEVAVEVCSQPTPDPASRRVYFAGMMTVEGDGYDDGAQYFVGPVHLPYWTEAIVRSHRYLCGGWLR